MYGGTIGRPSGSTESENAFLHEDKNQEILKYLKKDRTIREISKILDCSNKTVIKVKKAAAKYGMLNG
jgi:DNA-binding CsgD family transcriptional regulator